VITSVVEPNQSNNDHEKVFQIFHFFSSFCAQSNYFVPLPLHHFTCFQGQKVKKIDMVDGADMDKADLIKLKFSMDLGN
jgi:hypothetical protein